MHKSILSLRKVTIKAHCVQSNTHQKNMAKYIETLSDDDQIRILISKHFEEKPNERGHTIAPDVHVYRWRVCETLMYAGVPMAKINMLRTLLEREGHALSDRSEMSATYIPQIEDREIKRVVKELLEQHFAVIFDGTTRLGEAINIVTRSITDDFTIRMRLVAFKTTKVHCDGNALFRLIGHPDNPADQTRSRPRLLRRVCTRQLCHQPRRCEPSDARFNQRSEHALLPAHPAQHRKALGVARAQRVHDVVAQSCAPAGSRQAALGSHPG